jgi:nucleoside-diphosphate-sugar epimerase
MKNVLIIGGSYFVGRVFVEELLKKQGYSIYVLNRGRIPIKKEGVTEIVCDRHDTGLVETSLPDLEWHAVVDFCAYTAEDIRGMISVLPADKVRQYIFISTSSIYEKTWDFPVREDAAKLTGPQPELGPFADYGYNKWLSEIELEKQCGEKDISYTVIRPAFIYGKYNYAPRESYFFDLITEGKPVVIPENDLPLFSFVSVWDTAGIIIGCLKSSDVLNRAFNAAADDLVSYRRLVEVLETVSEKKLTVEELSVDEILEKQVPLPFPIDEHLVCSGSLIQECLDFQYTGFLEGMKETYRFYLIGKGLL